MQDLKSQHNFIVTQSSEAFAINSLWQVCNIENIREHLHPLKVLKELKKRTICLTRVG